MQISNKVMASLLVLVALVEASSRNFLGRKTISPATELTIGPVDAPETNPGAPPPSTGTLQQRRDSTKLSEQNPPDDLVLEKVTRLFDTDISDVPEMPTWKVPLEAPSSSALIGGIPTNTTKRQMLRRLFVFPNRKGRLDVAIHKASRDVTFRRRNDALDVSIDPLSGFRLFQIAFVGCSSIGAAVWGTLRVLAPLVVAAKSYRSLCDATRDMRTMQRTRTEKLLEYQRPPPRIQLVHLPPSLRSAGRLLAHVTLLAIVGRIVESILGLRKYPCQLQVTGGCRPICSILWFMPVLGIGQAISAAISIWGGPLELHAQSKRRRPSARHVFSRPYRAIEWLQHPDEWIRDVACDGRDIAPNLLRAFAGFLAFPSSFEPIWLLMMMGVTKEMASGPDTRRAMMRLVLLQHALRNEWHHVLLVEKRIVLGLVNALGYLASTVGLLSVAFRKPALSVSSLSVVFLLPSVLAVLVSAWINIVVYLDRLEALQQEAVAAENEAAAEAVTPYTTPNVPSLMQG